MRRRSTYLPAPSIERRRQAVFITVGTVVALLVGAAMIFAAGAPW